jgi:hypothetical protein
MSLPATLQAKHQNKNQFEKLKEIPFLKNERRKREKSQYHS